MGMVATQRNSTINISSIVKKRSKMYIKTMHEEIVRRVKAKVMLRQKKKKSHVEKKYVWLWKLKAVSFLLSRSVQGHP